MSRIPKISSKLINQQPGEGAGVANPYTPAAAPLWESPTMHVGSADGTATSTSIGYHGSIAWVDQGTFSPTKAPALGLNVSSSSNKVELYYVGDAKPHARSVFLYGDGITGITLSWNGTRYVSNDAIIGAEWWQFFSDNFNTNIALKLIEVS